MAKWRNLPTPFHVSLSADMARLSLRATSTASTSTATVTLPPIRMTIATDASTCHTSPLTWAMTSDMDGPWVWRLSLSMAARRMPWRLMLTRVANTRLRQSAAARLPWSSSGSTRLSGEVSSTSRLVRLSSLSEK